MENTLENKSIFFAQHLGQNCERLKNQYPYKKGDINSVLHCLKYQCVDKFSLLLMPLSTISDEDATHLGYDSARHVRDYYLLSISIERYKADYLRLKGYALPYMGLSISKLMEYGWIRFY